MKLHHVAGAFVAAAIGCFASPAAAQIPDDVAVEIASELTTFKASKKGGASAKITAITIFSSFSGMNLKAKATGMVNFYVSSNRTVNESSRYIGSKKINLKAMRPKFLKVKANLSNEDRGKYLVAEVISPQDNYHANDVDDLWIALDAF